MKHTELLAKPNTIEAPEPVSAEPEALKSAEHELSLAQMLGKKVCDEVQGLRGVYQERLQGYTIHVGNRIFEDEGFVTRRYAESDGVEVAAEEYYLHFTSHDVGRKSEFGPLEQTIVRIVTDDGEQELYVDEEGNARVMYREGADGEWRLVSSQTAEDWAGELSHRALIAAVRHGARTPEEKEAANAEARELLRKRFPMFGLHETTVE
jgi:hypothetical protein